MAALAALRDAADLVTPHAFLQLNMLGHDMSWAAFHVIEVMSQERFGLKRVGFLAASQSFTATTDVIVLCTQLLKKVSSDTPARSCRNTCCLHRNLLTQRDAHIFYAGVPSQEPI